MTELKEFFVSANKAMAGITVILIQIIKIWLTPDPSAPVGDGMFSVSARWKKVLLPLAFAIGIALSIVYDYVVPQERQSFAAIVVAGLQTGGLAVVMWEMYSNWVRPFFEKQA